MKYCIGERFGKITVVEGTKKIGRKKYQKIKCDCGNEKYVRIDVVCNTKSCGCINKNKFGLSTEAYEKLYNVWKNMRSRCYDTKSDRYYAYGKNGISICDEWKSDFHKFAEWAVTHGWNGKLSIERINVHGNYEPSNCTFITMKEQARNKTSNVLITNNGETKCITEWGEVLGIDPKVIFARKYRGITDPKILLYKGDLRRTISGG